MPVEEVLTIHEGLPEVYSEAATIAAYQAELRTYYVAIRDFSNRDITDILMAIAAFSGRASEIRDRLVVNEGKRAMAFRTKQLEPFLVACELQFKIWSRVQSVRQMDADLSRGGV